uniref:Uncharacterized protein n=1 Tax=Anguilla anguilla TaxID=7936 RepID=A0A0E9U3C6_ANGAN
MSLQCDSRQLREGSLRWRCLLVVPGRYPRFLARQLTPRRVPGCRGVTGQINCVSSGIE